MDEAQKPSDPETQNMFLHTPQQFTSTVLPKIFQ
jgi:hypothetical protein